MSADKAGLHRLVTAERELAEAVSVLAETEDDRLPTEHYAALCRALKSLRDGAAGYGLMMTVSGLQRIGRREQDRKRLGKAS
jgi:hypothetical protein